MSSNDSDEKSEETDLSNYSIEASNPPPQIHHMQPPPLMPPYPHPQFVYAMPMMPKDSNTPDHMQQQLPPMFPPYPMPYPNPPFPFENSFPPGFVPRPFPYPPPMMFMPVPMPMHDANTLHRRSEPSVFPTGNDNKVVSPDVVEPIDLVMLTSPSTSSTIEAFDVKIEQTSKVPESVQVNEQATAKADDAEDEEIMQSRVLRLRLKNKKDKTAKNESNPHPTAVVDNPKKSPKEKPVDRARIRDIADTEANGAHSSLDNSTSIDVKSTTSKTSTAATSSTESKSKALLSFLKSSPAPARPESAPTTEAETEVKPVMILKRDKAPANALAVDTAVAAVDIAVDTKETIVTATDSATSPTSSSKKSEKRRRNKAKDLNYDTASATSSNAQALKPQLTSTAKTQAKFAESKVAESKAAEPVPAAAEPVAAVNRSHQLRTTRNQSGKLVIMSSASNLFRPNQGMTVLWELPQSVIHATGSEKANLVIGLTRYGSAINLPCIIAKQIGRPTESFLDSKSGQVCVRGKISFFAPRSAGRFVYRLFDQSSTEKSRATLATSSDYFVELDEPNLDLSLKFIHELFVDKKDKNSSFKAVVQFTSFIDGIRPFSLGRGPRTADRMRKIIMCINLAIESLIEHGKVLDAALQLQESSSSSTPQQQQQSLTGVSIARKIHVETFGLFVALDRNKIIRDSLPVDEISTINNIMACYCKLLQRFFSSMETLQHARKISFSFIPASPSIQVSNIVIENLNTAIIQKISSLIPSVDFEYLREGIRRRIHDLIAQSSLVPPGTTVELYGSSKNNFGNSSSDVDMCILFSSGYSERFATTPEDRGKLMESIGNHLIASNMLDVQIIATARIPVVNFRDPVTGNLINHPVCC
jgi:hypothetical protein